jgi:broad specificity phosphatase PhoE
MKPYRKAEPAKRIASNSEPWIENPRTLEDAKEISARINEVLETWRPKGE